MRKILIVVDMQNDFIDMALGTKEAAAIVDAVKEKIGAYPPDSIFVTMDTHGADYLQTQEGRFLPVEHCIRRTEGWQLSPELAPVLAGAKVFEKPTFGSVQLAEELKALSETEELELELVGLCCAAAEGFPAGGPDHGRRFLLCRRDAAEASGRTRDHALLPDRGGECIESWEAAPDATAACGAIRGSPPAGPLRCARQREASDGPDVPGHMRQEKSSCGRD